MDYIQNQVVQQATLIMNIPIALTIRIRSVPIKIQVKGKGEAAATDDLPKELYTDVDWPKMQIDQLGFSRTFQVTSLSQKQFI